MYIYVYMYIYERGAGNQTHNKCTETKHLTHANNNHITQAKI